MVYELSWAKSSVPHVISYTLSLFHPFTLSPVRTPKVSHRGAPLLKSILLLPAEWYNLETIPHCHNMFRTSVSSKYQALWDPQVDKGK